MENAVRGSSIQGADPVPGRPALSCTALRQHGRQHPSEYRGTGGHWAQTSDGPAQLTKSSHKGADPVSLLMNRLFCTSAAAEQMTWRPAVGNPAQPRRIRGGRKGNMTSRYLVLMLAILALAACGGEPTPTPDLVATQIAVEDTLTARAAATATIATVEPSQEPTEVSTPTFTPAPTPQPPTSTSVPAPTPRLPASTSAPAPTPRPATNGSPTETSRPVGPRLGDFAVVGVYDDDVLNVRAGPGVDERIVGTIPYYGHDVEVHAGGQQVGESWWMPVRYGELKGWANSSFLASQVGTVSDAVAARAAQAILALRDHDMQALAGLVHPVKGVAFSPYTYVRTLQGAPGEADMVFGPAQLLGLWTDPTVYHWGMYDGSGEPIQVTFQEYHGRFVYDVDFAQPEVVGFDETVGRGNTLNNIATAYPDAVTVEYHFEGFEPQYAGMDWRSLRLVLAEFDGTWYLVGIVHDEWTI